MPVVVVFHERYASPLDRLGDNARRTFSPLHPAADRLLQFAQIVPVHFTHLPAEGRPFVRQRAEGQDFFAAAGRLPAIEVHDGQHIGEPASGGEHGRFPDRALVALAVAQHHPHPVVAPLDAARQRHAGAERQPVSQRARGHFHPRHATGTHLLRQAAARLPVGGQPVAGEKSPLGQHRIQRRRRMAFAEDEPVALRVLRLLRIDRKAPQ